MSDRPRPDLHAVLGSMTPSEAAEVRAWLGGDDRDAAVKARHLVANHEPIGQAPARPDAQDPRAIRRIGVIGGGTAGYLTALALQARRPWLEVTIVESPAVPIIGVGEATTPLMVTFLHRHLGIDPQELYARVQPTWKLGIKFDWGPDPDGFVAPFDWDTNSIGIRGSLAVQGNINAASIQALMMAADRTPVFEPEDGRYVSLMKYLPFAYHLDNGRFVAYLTELAQQRDIRHLDAQVDQVVLAGEDWIDHLLTSDGRELRFDMYVDCTGFRSRLLGKALDTRFHSFADSLFTDAAVTGNIDHAGHLKPYTTATTMNAGWHWTIPTRDSDHLGYVYCSDFLSEDRAADELSRRFPGITEPRTVRFRVGRYEQAWRGNVMAVGNSYAFVEPLQSSGLLLITWSALALASSLPTSWGNSCERDSVNATLGRLWDQVRWFLSIHYRFNTRLDTSFWKEARRNTDVSGLRPLLDVYENGAPLRFRDPVTVNLVQETAPTFYGLAGIDAILLGQRVPTRLLPPSEPADRWRARKSAAEALVRHALPQSEALHAFDSTARLHHQLLTDNDSWARGGRPGALF